MLLSNEIDSWCSGNLMKPATKQLWILGLCCILLMTACGCTSQSPPGITPTPQQTPAQSRTTVTIKGFTFNPTDLHIGRGQSVTWINEDAAEHQVVNDPFNQTALGAYFKSSSLAKGASYSFTFDSPGIYKYHCLIHPSMTGTITVT